MTGRLFALTLILAACAKTPKAKAVGTLVVDPPMPQVLNDSTAAEALRFDTSALVQEHVDRLNGSAFADTLASRFRPPLTAAQVHAALHAKARNDARVIEVAVALDDPAVARSLCDWALITYVRDRSEARGSDSPLAGTPPPAEVTVLDSCVLTVPGARRP